MNADFETELAHGKTYRRTEASAEVNRRLARHLLWLARPGDKLLVDAPPEKSLENEAQRREIELVIAGSSSDMAECEFTPWGWTPSAIEIGKRSGARVNSVPIEVVRRVNSKLWSHQLEVELGVTMRGAAVVESFEELEEAARGACPHDEDKWVVKSLFGFAARERVLGRGGRVEGPAATWARRRFARGETLIFQPWLCVEREYGVVMRVPAYGEIEILGVSDLRTNGAGTGLGYLLGRGVEFVRLAKLKSIAQIIGERLRQEGYTGPAGVDALEHEGGLHPLLEVNARYTMGFVALAVEQMLRPREPVFWSTK